MPLKRNEVFLEISKNEKPEIYFPAFQCFIGEMDGNSVQDKDSLLKAIASAFNIPQSYVENWDALLDCLRSLPDENEENIFVLKVVKYELLLKDSPTDKRNFEEIFAEAADFINDVCKKRLVLVNVRN